MCLVSLLQALLEQQLAVERSKMETERRRFQNAMDEKVDFRLALLGNGCLQYFI